MIGYHGGILTNSRKVTDHSDPEQQSISHCLHPGDLVPFTRKPMFLIVDSNNSVAFAVRITLTMDWKYHLCGP